MGKWQTRLVVAATALGILGYKTWSLTCQSWTDGSTYTSLMSGAGSVMLFVTSIMCLHAATLTPSDSHTLKTLVYEYIVCLMIHLLSPLVHQIFLKDARDCRKIQDYVLLKYLKQNADTVYGKEHDFKSIKSREDFVANHPFTDYSHYEKYVQRIVNGEQNIMTKDKVIYLALSSGTTGKNKMYPQTAAFKMQIIKLIGVLGYTMKGLWSQIGLRRRFQFAIHHPPGKTPGGIPTGGIGQMWGKMTDVGMIPVVYKDIDKVSPSYYVQAVFSLGEEDIAVLEGFSSDLWYAFFNFIEKNIDNISEDIAKGEIREMPELPEQIRQNLNKCLTPKPDRARYVQQIVADGQNKLAKKLWPQLVYIVMCGTGSFAHSATIMKQGIFKGIPSSFLLHGATEGLFGTGFEKDIESTLLVFYPYLTFLEFIKVEDIEKEIPKTYFMDQLEVGQCYEVVVTNHNGLCRNRFGDVIKVEGYLGNTPTYRFQYRTGQILNIAFERTPESVMLNAVKMTGDKWNKETIVNYTVVESMHIEQLTGWNYEPGRYVVFMELESSHILSDQEKDMLEVSLQETHETYKEYRQQGSIGPIVVIQVKLGTFKELVGILMGGRSNTQFKMPHVLRKLEPLTYLWNNRLQTTT